MLSVESLRDQVALANNPARLRRPCFAVIDALQKYPATRGEQLLAVAVTLIAMCESANYPLSDLLRKATNIMSAVEGPFTAHLQAVRDYAAQELLKGGI